MSYIERPWATCVPMDHFHIVVPDMTLVIMMESMVPVILIMLEIIMSLGVSASATVLKTS